MSKESKIALQKMLTGHFIEEIPEDFNKKIAYVWQGHGLWEVRKLPLGTFVSRVQEFKTPGLKTTLESGWKLNVPKIPAVLLDVTLSFFRQIYDKHSSEVFLQYFYDTGKEEYILHCPQQTVGPGSVNYKRDTEYEKDKILVFEIHSHGSMGAFFSGTDDRDEKDDRFFGVIGHVKNYYPELKIRLSVGGRRQDIEVDDIFNLEGSSYNKESFPVEWINRIKEKKVKIVDKRSHKFNKDHLPKRTNRSGGVIYYPVKDDDDDPLFDYSQLSIFDDGEMDPIPNVSGIDEDQKLIEKNGKIYMVTDTGTEEIWEEIETTKKRNCEGLDEKHWRDIKW